MEYDQSLREAAYREYTNVVSEMLGKAPKQSIREKALDSIRDLFIPISEKVPVEGTPEPPILHVAMQGGHVETVRAKLDHWTWRNVSITEMGEYGRCAIHVGAMKGH